jgi:deazaflavin-dependent oxidoreductase (nitroreductase family)
MSIGSGVAGFGQRAPQGRHREAGASGSASPSLLDVIRSPSGAGRRTRWSLVETMTREPFAARLHFIPTAIRRPQAALVNLFRQYFERAPGWVLLTTTGRKTGLLREVLLPCERSREALIVISTYGWRSHWIRNLQRDPRVRITVGGWVVSGRAEVIEDLERKHSIVSADPFFPPAPFAVVHAVLRTLLRPLLIRFLRRWVSPRPIVLIRPEALVSPESPQRDSI